MSEKGTISIDASKEKMNTKVRFKTYETLCKNRS